MTDSSGVRIGSFGIGFVSGWKIYVMKITCE